ncbi:MAG: alanine--tRNA ligase [Malacoplasma sp.]
MNSTKKYYSLSNIRKMWIDFFVSNKHTLIASQSLIPKDDDSLLWINSGVATLKKYFSGTEQPPSTRLVNSQRCIRTNDIENVGITSRHHTFFEMLGNFSIGDYFRKEAINFAFEFLVKILKIDINKLYITVFNEDDESYQLWLSHGIDASHIIKCDRTRNFWNIGQGPCGPCTEIYYDRGTRFDPSMQGEKLFFDDIENDRYIEIWNIVFSEFENDGSDNYTTLFKKNIDTGAGLERLACILQDVPTNYDIDAFEDVKSEIQKHTSEKYDMNLYFSKNKDDRSVFINKCFSVIVDHLRAIIFSVSDGVIPSNKSRGYIIRKLLRRYFFYLSFLKIANKDIHRLLISKIVNIMSDFYTHLKDNISLVVDVVESEFILYNNILKKSVIEFESLILLNKFNEENLFHLVDTYGFPLEILKELEYCNNDNLISEMLYTLLGKKIFLDKKKIDFDLFNKYFDQHRDISKSNKLQTQMDKQNQSLINLSLNSIFDYDIFTSKSKIIKIFDINFNEISEAKNQDCYIVLDLTCFYATSGGQVNDVGTMNGFNVVDVIKGINGQNIHKVLNANLKLNQIVDCVIDLEKRNFITKNHSVEHLLHSCLKKTISESIKQEGAFKSSEKVTFDFNYSKKITINELFEIEKEIKRIIDSKINVETLHKDIDEAKKVGALAYFENVYKKIQGKLRVVKMGDYSIEICGGTHVKNTSEVEDFKIIKLDSKGSGTWRLECITSHKLCDDFNKNVLQKLEQEYKRLFNTYKMGKIKNDEIEEILQIPFIDMHYLEKKNIVDNFNNHMNIMKIKREKEESLLIANDLKNDFLKYNEKFNYIYLENIDGKLLFNSLINLINENQNSIYFVVNDNNVLFQYYLCTNEIHQKSININFNIFSKEINEVLNGKGGGKPNFVQGSFSKDNKSKIDSFVATLKEKLNL